MTWVIFAVATMGVAAFLLYLFVFRWNRMARLGDIEVPGESVVELPAGKVNVFYEDRFKWRYSERARPWEGFSMIVSDAQSGHRIDLGQAPDVAIIKTRGKNRIPFGTLDIPKAGRYRVDSQIDADATDPRITFG